MSKQHAHAMPRKQKRIEQQLVSKYITATLPTTISTIEPQIHKRLVQQTTKWIRLRDYAADWTSISQVAPALTDLAAHHWRNLQATFLVFSTWCHPKHAPGISTNRRL
jgi:hypothetical protein